VRDTAHLLSVQETACRLNVSPSWVRRHLAELPVVPMLGRMIRIDSAQIESRIDSRKSLEPKEPIMVNRYQRGGVYKQGKKQMWYGTFRMDGPSGRKQKNVPLGTVKELPTKSAARKKLDEVIALMAKPEAGVAATKTKKFSELVTEWKANEGVALGRVTMAHYSNALRANVIPTFGDHDIQTINRKSIQSFLAKQAEKYSRSSLRSMRLVLCMTLGWAERNGEIQQPNGWLDGIRLPKKVGGRTVVRTELTPTQTLAFVERLREPYSTLVLCVASLALRGEEAVGLQPDDLDQNNVLHVRRVIYDRQMELLEKEKQFPLDAVVHADLIRRLRALGVGQEWIFHSRAGTPVDLGNARRRHLHPAAAAIGVVIGGWHDFRHTLVRMMRRGGENPVVISGVVGHKSVEMAAEVYDRASVADIGQALSLVGKQLLQNVLQNPSVQ
jgi:integrase